MIDEYGRDTRSTQRNYSIEDWIAFCLFWALTGVVFLQFSARYFGLGSFPWTEESARYLLILLTFSGAALAIRRRSHVAMTMLHNLLPHRVRSAVEGLIGLTNMAFYGIAAWMAWQVGLTQSAQRMASLNLPIRYLYWIITGALILLTVRAAVQTVADYRRSFNQQGK